MNKLLVVVDMQKDFIDGSLGTAEAQAMLPTAVEKIKAWDGDIVCTLDTHFENYLETAEGKKLPVEHCIRGTEGWALNTEIAAAVGEAKCFEKPTFGSVELMEYIKNSAYEHIEFIGLCTDICVISNVLLTKAALPESRIIVDAACCAGVTPQSHINALEAMKMCQIDIVNY